MPSKKQRRRREKLRRHEWEEVLIDEDGNEIVIEPSEARKKETPAKARATRPGRPIREVQPPSWQRVAKRAALFAPVMFIMVTIISGAKLTMGAKVVQTLMLLAFFLPFSYLMDTFAYKTYRKRIDRTTS
jgi:hypothetical protein